MLIKVPSEGLYEANHGWLVSRFHFSFAEYYNPDNINFGALRVLNDDIVKPATGFETHPHNNMEIISYCVSGELTHRDSMGYKETLTRGDVQYMSAGTGLTHSELNESKDKTLRFLQIWIMPASRGLKTQYGSKKYKKLTGITNCSMLLQAVMQMVLLRFIRMQTFMSQRLIPEKQLIYQLNKAGKHI